MEFLGSFLGLIMDNSESEKFQHGKNRDSFQHLFSIGLRLAEAGYKCLGTVCQYLSYKWDAVLI